MAAADSSAETLRSRLRQQEIVSELGQRALESDDVDGLLTDAVEAVGDALEVDACSVFELRPDGDAVVLRAGAGRERDAVGSTAVSVDADSWVETALGAGDPVAADRERADRNAASLERGPLADSDGSGGSGGLGVAIESAAEPWGVLVVRAAEREFAAHEVDFVASVADLLAAAVENHRARQHVPADDAVADGIVETSPTGITVVDADGSVAFANERAAEIFGRTRAEITSLSHDDPRWDMRDESGDPVPPDEMPFERVLERGTELFDLEVNVRRPDDTRVWLSINAAPLRTDDGAVTSAVFAIEDVTERKRLESELETTFDRVTDAFFGLDADWSMTYVNERAQELIDPDDEGLLGESIWEAFPAIADSTFETEYRRAMAAQEQTSFEAYFPPFDAWYEVHAYPSKTGLSVYFRDVTDRKETERELAETNRTLQRLYEITADSERTFDEKIDELLALGRDRLGLEGGFLARIDESEDRFEVTHASGPDERFRPGTVASLSTTYCKRTVDSDDLLAFTDSPLEHGVDEDAYAEWGLDSYLGGRVTVDGERYGTLCFEDRSARSDPFTPAERSFVELATQWISYELERRAHRRDLEESNRRLEQFAYAASHDLQEPLRMVSSYLTLVEGRYGDELDADGEEFIAFAVDGADRMQVMIDGLLAYSRVDTQGDTFRPVDCEAVIDDVLADLEVRIDETDAEIEVGSLPRVDGDPGQLRQLFQNLLDNAITYSGDGTPRISVFAENDGSTWMVSVRDRGIGIDPDDADRIFRVFDRLHSHEEYPGTGIGLALCRRIAERHGGEITVDSRPGEGSTFTVTLPALSDAESEPEASRAADAERNAERSTHE